MYFFLNVLLHKKESIGLCYSTGVVLSTTERFLLSFLALFFSVVSGVKKQQLAIDLFSCLIPSVCLTPQSVGGKPDVNVPWGLRRFHLPELSECRACIIPST